MQSFTMIPQPAQLQRSDGYFALSHTVTVHGDSNLARNAIDWFVQTFYQQSGVKLGQSDSAQINLREQSDIAPESYALGIAPDGIEIRASDANGYLYGMVSLLQTIPFDSPSNSGEWALPALEIYDEPRFGWRGLMIDSVRHFQSVCWIKKFINAMALHKFNRLHWHLVDDQGWRVEIEKYPLLTSVSAWRAQSRVGHEDAGGPDDFDGRPHGGFYSKAELREVVAYALARGITVVPEIEMPGHATSVIAAYPALSCAGGTFEVTPRWGIFDDVYCAGSDETIRFLEGVLDEVLEIFPSEFIHIGGDECPKTRWKECPKCQARIESEGLKDEDELQSWLVRHFDKFLTERGRRLIGWDEILEGGLAPHAAVMSWRSEAGGIAAAKIGHDVVMAPHQHTYFDQYQCSDSANEPLAIGGCLSLQNVFDYEPVPAELNADQAVHVLGGQGQLWSEYLPNTVHLEYMAFPRACALAERLWSAQENRDFADFEARLRGHLKLLDRLGINYRALKH